MGSLQLVLASPASLKWHHSMKKRVQIIWSFGYSYLEIACPKAIPLTGTYCIINFPMTVKH
jgi:hypothetical protein